MAGDYLAIPLLIGLGLTELSMNARSIPVVKNLVRQLNVAQEKEWADQVLTLCTTSEIKHKLEEIAANFER